MCSNHFESQPLKKKQCQDSCFKAEPVQFFNRLLAASLSFLLTLLNLKAECQLDRLDVMSWEASRADLKGTREAIS